MKLNATDYLLKPFALERFNDALNKAMEKLKTNKENKFDYGDLINSANENIENLNRIVVKTNQKISIIPS